ncbi:HSPB1-associated protein 1 homolog isoform X1 [Asterias amurensis]|uniref:HSPB1-associated protein 1 homolog isoform X1 n=1 Tax=Asterias amurensis TaxID=7602 RepID=UPI003AB4F07F
MQHSAYLGKYITDQLSKPTVLKGTLEKWPSRKWTPDHLASILKQKVKIRIGPISAQSLKCSVLWETECTFEEATLDQFCMWLDSDSSTTGHLNSSGNPLLKYNREEHWCYVDYKEMAVLFKDHPDILKAVQWKDLGFPNRDGRQSTIWIGSEQAFTPGHYDTYGFNLVAQIYGRKRWHLFPPNQTHLLYPTRIPYEESSVFSPINIANPCIEHYSRLVEATPYTVTLEAGDVLFVPKHWWHFVESLEVSMSINTWVEVESDKVSRVHEAVTRALVSGLMSGASNQQDWLNPTEGICEDEVNYRYIRAALQECSTKQSSQPSKQVPVVDSLQSTSKTDKTRISNDDLPHSSQLSQVEVASSEKVVKKMRVEETQVGRKSSTVDMDLEETANNQCQRCEDESLQVSIGFPQAGPEVKEEGSTTSRDKTALRTQSLEDDSSFTGFIHDSHEEDNVSTSQKTFKSCLGDDTGSNSQSQSHHGEPVDLISNFIVAVKCQGAIYKTDHHPTTLGCCERSLQGGSNMPKGSEVKQTLPVADIRQLLVECVTHPSVIDLTSKLLRDKFYQKQTSNITNHSI